MLNYEGKLGDVLELANRIARTIDSYLVRHPQTTWQQVREALTKAMDAVAKAEALQNPTPPSGRSGQRGPEAFAAGRQRSS